MDEMFETATLMHTDKVYDFPVVAMGSNFWKPLGPFLEETMISHGTIDENDLDFARMTDDPEEALEIIRLQSVGERL